MLVTFKTSSYPDITMFGSAAVALLKMMGQSGNVPGAIMTADVPDALKKLEQGLVEAAAREQAESADADEPVNRSDGHSSSDGDDEDEPAAVSLTTRARPLVELLQSARDAGGNVVWDE